MNATTIWSHWQGLLSGFARCFTVPGWKRFVEWITALVLNVEEHTITQSVIAVQQIDDWKAMETFAETGAWDSQGVEDSLAQVIETAPGRIWHGFHVSAVDDTKVHRSSPEVWGTCTFHEYTARCPNRAATVRAHNWVVWARCCTIPINPPGSCPRPVGCTSGNRSCPAARTPPVNGTRSVQM